MLAMAGDRITMAENALMMIHDPWVMTSGNADELRRLADTLDKHRDVMVSAYRRRSGKSAKAIIAIMAAETWYSAPEALAAGFIDAIAEPLAIAASFDLSQFQLPERFQTMAQTTTTDKPVKPVPEIDAAVKAERERIQARNTEIGFMFQKHLSKDGVQALYNRIIADTEMDPAAAGKALLDHLGKDVEPLTPQGWSVANDDFARAHGLTVSGGVPTHGAQFVEAVTDAILMRHGVPVKNPHPGARDVRGMGMAEIAASLLSQRGRTVRGASKAEVIQAVMTTSDLPALLENVATKSLMTGFRESEAASHRIWTREGSLPDFKEARRTALSEAPALSIKPEGAEYQHGSVSDANETIQLATYGKIVKLSRESLVNDDLGELARLPLAMGQAAARSEADLVYGLLVGNPNMRDGVALFDATHGNIGGSATLSEATLSSARVMMRTQKGLAGTATLNIVPRFLLVPAALETAAEKLLASIQPTSSANVVPEWMRRLTLVVDARLDEDSTARWYLAADPAQFDTVEVARLDGNGAQAFTDEDFHTDAVSFKIRLDVGAAILDWRGLVRNGDE